jgi:hypothetical protein
MSAANVEENNYVVLVPFNGTDGPGGNPLVENVNIWYQVGSVRPLPRWCSAGE